MHIKKIEQNGGENNLLFNLHIKLSRYAIAIDQSRIFLFFILLILSLISVSLAQLSFCLDDSIINGDQSIFALIGKSWLLGYLPYRDLFDHKGPLLFLAYTCAALFPNIKVGIYIISVVLFFVNTALIYRIGRLYVSPLSAWCVLLIAIVPYITLMGLTCEELSLPFNLLPLYLIFKTIRQRNTTRENLSTGSAFIIGLCLGINFMIRANNAAPTIVSMFPICLQMLICGDWKSFFRVIGAIAAGIICLILPFLIYFYAKGALDDFIYGNIIFNIEYTNGVKGLKFSKNLIKSTYLPFLVILSLFNLRNKQFSLSEIITFSLIVISSLAVSCMAYAFSHYLITAIPAYVIVGIMALKMRDCHPLNRFFCIVIILLLTLPHMKPLQIIYGATGLPVSEQAPKACKTEARYLQDTVLPVIPTSERNSFLAVGLFGGEYLAMNLIPCSKFFCLQGTHTDAIHSQNHQIFYQMMKSNPPKWILTGYKDIPSKTQYFLDTKYKIIYSDNVYKLHRLTVEMNTATSLIETKK